jgi:hypothetical protein
MYEIARQLQAPGVQTIATFNPTRLTKALRNMVRKSIATGNHIGGWTSKTRDVRNLVFKLAGEEPIVYVAQATDYMAFAIPRPITTDNLFEIIGLLEADCSLQKMDYDVTGERSWTPPRHEYNQTIDRRHLDHVRYLRTAHEGVRYNLVVRTPKIRQQITEVFLKERTVEEIAIAERIARILDRDEEFPIPSSHSF